MHSRRTTVVLNVLTKRSSSLYRDQVSKHQLDYNTGKSIRRFAGIYAY